MNRPDARAGLHRDDRLGHHRHVHDDAVAFAGAQCFECVSKLTDFGMQLAITQVACVALLTFEANRDLVTAAVQMAVNAVVGDIQAPIREPAVVGRIGGVQANRKRGVPVQLLACPRNPECFIVLSRFGV